MLALDRLILEICLAIWARKQGFSWEANLNVRERRGEQKEGTSVVGEGKDGPREVKHEAVWLTKVTKQGKDKETRWDPSWELLRGAGERGPCKKRITTGIKGKVRSTRVKGYREFYGEVKRVGNTVWSQSRCMDQKGAKMDKKKEETNDLGRRKKMYLWSLKLALVFLWLRLIFLHFHLSSSECLTFPWESKKMIRR